MTKEIDSLFNKHKEFLGRKISENICNHLYSDASFQETMQKQKAYESKLDSLRHTYSNWQSIDPSKVSDEEIRGVFRGHYINSKN